MLEKNGESVYAGTWVHGHVDHSSMFLLSLNPDMIDLIHQAVECGVTFLDTSDIYGPHTNEVLLGKALKGGVKEKVELATNCLGSALSLPRFKPENADQNNTKFARVNELAAKKGCTPSQLALA
ncbi:hypothetical protein JHK82_027074 [Glycine max]|nr:hypothetical protein JHK82_027074 [Glycine max]